MRMQAYDGGPARPSPVLGETLNAGFRYLEVTCGGCDTCNTVDLTIVRRATEMPIWQLERRMRCRPCSEERDIPIKRGHLVRLRRTNITTAEDGECWYPGEQRGRREIASNQCEYRVDRGVDGSGFLRRRRADDLTVQASIVDGDTLESHETRVRLWGGDAPASSQLCRGEECLVHHAAALAWPSRQFKRRSRECGSGRPPTFDQFQFAG
jgi:hypothetical protein